MLSMTYEHPSIVECHETFVRDESWLKEKKIKLVNGGKLLKETRFEIDPWIAQSHLNQYIATSWAC
jgi:hypothetical protein